MTIDVSDLGFSPIDVSDLGFRSEEPHPYMDAGKAALRVAGKAVDYPGGAVRTGLSSLVEAAGGPKTMSAQEKVAALLPTTTQRAPGTGEMLARAGVPAGPRPSDLAKSKMVPGYLRFLTSLYAKPGSEHAAWRPEVGGLADPSVRDVGGMAADMVLDPFSHGLGGGSKVAEGVINPVSTAAEHAGTSLYKSGIKPIIQEATHHGNAEVGNTMLKYGISGSPPAIRRGMESTAGMLKASRDADIATGEGLGALASKAAAYSDILADLTHKATRADLGGSQRMSPDTAYKIFQDATEVQQAGHDSVAPSIMSQWKTDTRNGLPGATWNELSKTNPDLADKAVEAIGSGYQKEVERSLSRVSPGLGSQVASKNKELGDLINKYATGAATKMADTYDKTPFISKSDMLLGALGMGASGVMHTGHTAEAGAGIIAVKKAIDALRSTRFKTTTGKGLKRFSENPLLAVPADAASRQLIINTSPYDTEKTKP